MKKILGILALLLFPVFVLAGTIERVSIPAPEFVMPVQLGNADSDYPVISEDNRYVAFDSAATNLVVDDTNGSSDIFVYDRTNDTIERVSVTDGGGEGNGSSSFPTLSSDGRYVAFFSAATNLVADDTNGVLDIFVYDRTNDTIERVSVTDGGVEGNNNSTLPVISSDGRYVAFESDATNLVAGDTNAEQDIFVYDRTSDTVERVSINSGGVQGNSYSENPSISSDGRYVAFRSGSSNFVSPSAGQVFVYDRDANTIEQVSQTDEGVAGGGANPAISGDGRYVAFWSSSNLVPDDTNVKYDVYVFDRTLDTVERVSISTEGDQGDNNSSFPTISSDGRYVAFRSDATNLVAGDTNTVSDVFVYDRDANIIERASIDENGEEVADPSQTPYISDDGAYVLFPSLASTLTPSDSNGRKDIFVHERLSGQNTLISKSALPSGDESNNSSSASTVSSDGRYVAFQSDATNLVPNDLNSVTDIFVYDRTNDTIERVSIDSDGVEGNLSSSNPVVSGNGRYVAFHSDATNLIASDTNNTTDVFVYDRDTDTIERVSIRNGGVETVGASFYTDISSDGRYVAFESADDMVPDDTNETDDIFVYDRDTDTVERVSINDSGVEGNDFSGGPSLSSDGQFVGFYSSATNLVTGDTNGSNDAFVYDRTNNTIERISVSSGGVEGNDRSYAPTLSEQGRYVVFRSRATNLVASDTNGFRDIFVYDRDTDTTERVSIASDGSEGDGDSEDPVISSGGRYVAFSSDATNFVVNDTNAMGDIFVYDRDTDTIERVSVDDSDIESDGDSAALFMSLNGRYVTFHSGATNLVPNDTNAANDIFVVDRGVEEVVEEEPEEEEEDQGENDSISGGGGGSGKGKQGNKDQGIPVPLDDSEREELVKAIQEKLIQLLTELIALLMAQR